MGDVIAGAPADSVRMSTSAALSIDTQPVRALPSRSAMGACTGDRGRSRAAVWVIERQPRCWVKAVRLPMPEPSREKHVTSHDPE